MQYKFDIDHQSFALDLVQRVYNTFHIHRDLLNDKIVEILKSIAELYQSHESEVWKKLSITNEEQFKEYIDARKDLSVIERVGPVLANSNKRYL